MEELNTRQMSKINKSVKEFYIKLMEIRTINRNIFHYGFSFTIPEDYCQFIEAKMICRNQDTQITTETDIESQIFWDYIDPEDQYTFDIGKCSIYDENDMVKLRFKYLSQSPTRKELRKKDLISSK